MRNRSQTSVLAILTALAWLSAGSGAVAADSKPKDASDGNILTSKQLEFVADEVIYDKDLNSVTAQGHVEIHRETNTLHADTVTYNLTTGTVTAKGNVTVTDRTGNTLYANVMELDNELRNGFIKGVHIVFNDNSRAAATEGQRENGSVTRLKNAIYSPCAVCDEDPNDKPLWDVRARRVIYDQNKHTITYHDAFLEFFGIPIIYTPYFKHADPTVKRQSGFLAPDVGNSTSLGLQAQIPYYWNISPTKDFTFSPLFTTNAGVVAAGQYRQIINSGSYYLEGGITRVGNRSDTNLPLPGHQVRGYVKGEGLFNITDNSRWGFNGEWTADDTFLRLYGFDLADTLTSRLYYERFDGRSYGEINTYGFQGLRAQDIAGQTPTALPWITYHFVSKPMFWNSVLRSDIDLLNLQRTSGPDTRRFSINSEWEVPYTSPAGDIYRLTLRARGDVYQTRGYDPFGNPTAPSNDRVKYPFPARNRVGMAVSVDPADEFVLSGPGAHRRRGCRKKRRKSADSS